MPTEHTYLSYTFDELTSEAQERAVDGIAAKLAGDWWDESNNEDVADSIRYKFAEEIGTPKVDQFGEADFPGTNGVKLESWSVGHVQSDHVGFAGTLTRENAPSLPWIDGIDHVTLEAKRSHTSIWFAMSDDEDDDTDSTPIDCDVMRTAVESAIHAAHQAGYATADYIGSEDNAREWIENNAPDFHEDGTAL